MKASEWNKPESMNNGDTVWIAVKTETGMHIDEGYKRGSMWFFSTGERIRFFGVVVGWLPKVVPAWEPDNE